MTDAIPQPESLAEPESFSHDYVRQLREENKSWRLKAAEQESRAKTAEDAARDRLIQSDLTVAALKAGMLDLDGLKLIDRAALNISEAGIEDADEAIAELKRAKPYFFGASPTYSSHPAPAPQPKSPTSRLATDMSPDEYAKAKTALKKLRV